MLRGEGKVMSKTEIRLREAARASLLKRSIRQHVLEDRVLAEAVQASEAAEEAEQKGLEREVAELRHKVAELEAERRARVVDFGPG